MNNPIVEELPGLNGNTYSSSRYLYNAIKFENLEVLATNRILTEGVDWEVPENEQGGMIILSTDVNAVPQNKNKVIDWVKKKAKTIKNRLTGTKKIDKVSQKNDLVGWTVGKFLSGRYTAKNGKSFGENSLSVELVGVPSDTLIKVASELCKEFDQESVLVKDYTNKKIYFVNAE